MKTLIVYASQYGTTEKCAKLLAQSLAAGADLFDLKNGAPDLASYDTVIVGGSVRASALLKPAKQFVQKQEAALLQKRLGLFLCSAMLADAPQHFEQNFSAALLSHAVAKGAFGGEFSPDKMGFFAKKIVGAVMGKGDRPLPKIDEEAVKAFAMQMDAA